MLFDDNETQDDLLIKDMTPEELDAEYERIFGKITFQKIDDFMKDIDNFVLGNKNAENHVFVGINLPKLSEYLKKTGKTYEELTKEEIEKLK